MMTSKMLKIVRNMLGGRENEDLHQSSSVDKNSKNPNLAYEIRRKHDLCPAKIVESVDPKSAISGDIVRFVCISDTHCKAPSGMKIPDGDVLIYAGDFTMFGHPDEVNQFNNFLNKQPHRHKVVIAGNHDVTFDLEFLKKHQHGNYIQPLTKKNYENRLKFYSAKTVHDQLTNCIYLQDSGVQIYGFRIFGSPWSPGGNSWGFTFPRGSIAGLEKWQKIPEDTDILITHGPPCGYGDDTHKGRFLRHFGENHVGCVDLLNTVKNRVKPKYHIFGHIHEGYGMESDGTTTFVNAATCTVSYIPSNPPLVFDLPLPQGYTKSSPVVMDT